MAELFKFRCYVCNQLLGGPASRVGSTTKCPKCGTDLVIPPPLASPDPSVEPAIEPEILGIQLEGLGLNLDRPRPSRSPDPSPVEVEIRTFLEKNEANPSEAMVPTNVEPPEELPDPAILPELPDPTNSTLIPRSSRPRQSTAPSTGRRDVILPRTAVIAWAMFALMSLGFAFVTGLLVGHFLWRR